MGCMSVMAGAQMGKLSPPVHHSSVWLLYIICFPLITTMFFQVVGCHQVPAPTRRIRSAIHPVACSSLRDLGNFVQKFDPPRHSLEL